MVEFTVTAKKCEPERVITGSFEFGANAEDAISKFGAEVVYDGFVDACTVRIQAGARRMLEAKNEDGTQKYSDQDVLDYNSGYEPGVRTARASADPVAKAKAILEKLSPEQLAELKAAGIL
jgi:hypothetical protein